MTTGDLPQVEAIAEIVHPAYPEAPEVFADRLRLFAAGCLMAVDQNGTSIGYCLSHPGIIGHPPALNTVLGALPATADCLYLHDVALLPAARGHGLGKSLARQLDGIARAHGLAHIALTAVNGSDGFWQSLRFAPHPCPHLDSYGDASYRLRPVTSIPAKI